MKRTRVLICWYEIKDRPELLAPFIDMSDEIEFVHLFYRQPSDRKEVLSPFEMIYWFDFSSPYKLLNKIKPEKVIVMDVAELTIISLVAACKTKKIPTYLLQHGYVPENLDAILVDVKRKSIFSRAEMSKYFKLLRFYLNGLSFLKLGSAFRYTSFLFPFFRQGGIKSLYTNRFDLRIPDYYICFSASNAQTFIARDQVDSSRILIIGIPTFDDLFKSLNAATQESSSRKYYLLIDTNFEEYKNMVNDDKILRCYKELATYCESKNASLKVKLHPWSYNYKYEEMVESPNVEFIRNVSQHELGSIVKHSEGCFGFYSTLSFPALNYRNFCHLKYGEVEMPDLENQKIAQVLDFFTFTSRDIRIDTFPVNDENKLTYLEYNLGYTDGATIERLKSILLNDNS